MLLSFFWMGLQVLFRWQRQREREREEDREFQKKQFEAEQMEKFNEKVERREQAAQAQARTKEESESKSTSGPGQGGYIILDMPDSKKPLFHDLLRGFEDYARLRGYEIQFSVDNTVSNEIAFKFTLSSGGITVSTQQVRQDLKDYIEKVQRGDSLDDLPTVLPTHEHDALILAMKNRISFLQHTYGVQKNAIEFYEKLLRELPIKGFGVQPAPNFYLTGGGNIESPTYTALNSPQAAQGSNIKMIGNKNDQSIYIAESFNERKTQVDAIEHLIYKLLVDKTEGEKFEEARREALKFANKAKDELADEEHPEPSRISNYLQRTKQALATCALGYEVVEASKKVMEAFHLLS